MMDERTIVLLTFALACYAVVQNNAFEKGLLEEARELSRAQNDPTRTTPRPVQPQSVDSRAEFAYGMSRQAKDSRLLRLGQLMNMPGTRLLTDTHDQSDEVVPQMTFEQERASFRKAYYDRTQGLPVRDRGRVSVTGVVWDSEDWARMGRA